MNAALRMHKPEARRQGVFSASPPSRLRQRTISQREPEADGLRMPDQGVTRAMPWDASRIPVRPPARTRHSSAALASSADRAAGSIDQNQNRLGVASRPRIDLGAISFRSFSAAALRDGSPDDEEAMQEDQDALVPSVFEPGKNKRGVHIRVTGGNPAGTPDFPNGIRWVQTIDTNAPLFGQSPPYVDFIPPKDDKPFYFSDAQENATFSDNPTRKANGVRWDATLSLVGVRGRTITRLDSVNYGFDIDASGTLSLHRPSTTGVASLVIHGDTLRSEYPNWVFSGGFAVPQVPSGGGAGGTAIV